MIIFMIFFMIFLAIVMALYISGILIMIFSENNDRDDYGYVISGRQFKIKFTTLIGLIKYLRKSRYGYYNRFSNHFCMYQQNNLRVQIYIRLLYMSIEKKYIGSYIEKEYRYVLFDPISYIIYIIFFILFTLWDIFLHIKGWIDDKSVKEW